MVNISINWQICQSVNFKKLNHVQLLIFYKKPALKTSDKIKNKRWRKIYHNTSQKKVGVVILISD